MLAITYIFNRHITCAAPKIRNTTKNEYKYITQQSKDILKDQWTPALTVKTAMMSLQALLCSPEPNDPQGMYNIYVSLFMNM